MTARDRTILIAILVIAALAGTWLLAIAPERNQASKLGSQISSAKTQLDSARAQVAAGEAARTTFATSYTTMARLGEAVPADDNVPLPDRPGPGRGQRHAHRVSEPDPEPGQRWRGRHHVGIGGAGRHRRPAPRRNRRLGRAPDRTIHVHVQRKLLQPLRLPRPARDFVTATNQRISVRGRLMTLNAISLAAGPHGFPQITATVSATTYIVPAAEGVLAGATRRDRLQPPVSTSGAPAAAAPGTASR